MSRIVAASVHQRLLNRARKEGRPFDELLHYFALERFLHRLSRSAHGQLFVVKGALMFAAWQGPLARSTRDVDLLGHLDNAVDVVVRAMREICGTPVGEDDGLCFHDEAVRGEPIAEFARYEGVRVHLLATLGTARIRFRVDVGFGDAVVPGPAVVSLPSLLDFPPTEILGTSRESMVAEKFHAMVRLGLINSRMKDFYDVWWLARRFEFEGPLLARAVGETFRRRETPLPLVPVALTDTFALAPDKQIQWSAFLRRLPPDAGPPVLSEAVRTVAGLLRPLVRSLVEEREFGALWPAGGPWQELPPGTLEGPV